MKARLLPYFATDVAADASPAGTTAPVAAVAPGAGHVASAAEATKQLSASQLAAEIAMRLAAIAVFSIFASAALHQFLRDPSRLTLILLVCSESLTLALAVATRVPRQRDWNAVTVLVAMFASFYFLAFSMKPGVRLIPESVAAGLQIVGMIVQIGAKLTLRRSYGILPANRGVVVGGPYRFVRHPIYLGYFIYNVGFLLPSFGLRNLLVLLVLWTMQLVRIVREERVLRRDPAYQAYMQRVRYRFIPGVF